MSATASARRRLSTVAAVILALALSACSTGGASEEPDGAETESIGTGTVVPVSGFEYGYELEAPTEPGTYTFELTNDGAMQHDLVIEGGEATGATAVIAAGETDSFTVALEPGEYTLYCSVAVHRSQGMEVTFTVS